MSGNLLPGWLPGHGINADAAKRECACAAQAASSSRPGANEPMKQWIKRLSIRHKLMLICFVTTGLAIMATTVVVNVYQARDARNQLSRNLVNFAE